MSTKIRLYDDRGKGVLPEESGPSFDFNGTDGSMTLYIWGQVEIVVNETGKDDGGKSLHVVRATVPAGAVTQALRALAVAYQIKNAGEESVL